MTVILVIAYFLFVIILSSYFTVWVYDVLGLLASLLALGLSYCALFAIPFFGIDLFKFLKENKDLTAKDWWYLRKISYLGERMPGCQREIMQETFHSYVTKKGKEIPFIKVSENERWVKIQGKYYPLDFLCGYNDRGRVIYTISGEPIPLRQGKPEFTEGLTEFLKDHGTFFDETPLNAKGVFDSLVKDHENELLKYDFGRLRYLWESNIVADSDLQISIYDLVLSDIEISNIADAIKMGEKRLGNYLIFEKYKNEYNVCNGVKLLMELGYPDNAEGMDFLFDCLGDVDEPYFLMAVEELMKFPPDKLGDKIEEKAKIAYETRNVNNMAGIMFLAKRLNYEIEFVKNIGDGETFEMTSGAAGAYAYDEVTR